MRSVRGVRNGAVVGMVALVLGAAAEASAAIDGYTRSADRACTAAGLKVEHLSTRLTLKVIEQEESIASALVNQLKQITPPAASATTFKRFISETEAQVLDVKAAVTAARMNRPRPPEVSVATAPLLPDPLTRG